jgi:hypothetical protein
MRWALPDRAAAQPPLRVRDPWPRLRLARPGAGAEIHGAQLAGAKGVVAFCQARNNEGGEGALIVLLRRPPAYALNPHGDQSRV